MGESILEASMLNLDAITLARMEVLPADARSDSPFTGAVYAEIVDVKAPRKPYTTLQVINKLLLAAQLPVVTEVTVDTPASILQVSRAIATEDIACLREAAKQYKWQVTPERATAVDGTGWATQNGG